jgi:hypothetical protein
VARRRPIASQAARRTRHQLFEVPGRKYQVDTERLCPAQAQAIQRQRELVEHQGEGLAAGIDRSRVDADDDDLGRWRLVLPCTQQPERRIEPVQLQPLQRRRPGQHHGEAGDGQRSQPGT